MRYASIASLVMLVTIPSLTTAQQSRLVRGVVADTSGVPLAGALVAVVGAGRSASTVVGATGRLIMRVGDGTRLVAARIGFAPETLLVRDSLSFTLRPAPVQLEPIAGFDADHGTDVALNVDGTPVNMVSHAHGQGYADLHWLMPEVVGGVDVRKGPYDAADGDFATAGAISFVTRDRPDLPGAWFEARGGSFGTVSGFAAEWDASGQVPERAVAAGTITRFGSIDPNEGGHTQRQEASIAVRSVESGISRWEVRAFAAHSQLRLFSDFTFYLSDTLNGDGIAQFDDRTFAGFRATHARTNRLFGRAGSWDAGSGMRSDWARVGLAHQRARTILATSVDDRISQQSFNSWARQTLELSRQLRVEAALRADVFRFGDRAGVAWRAIVNPKLNAAFELTPGTTLFLNAAGLRGGRRHDGGNGSHPPRGCRPRGAPAAGTLSRLPGEAPEGIEELHFTPGSPRAAQLAVAYRF